MHSPDQDNQFEDYPATSAMAGGPPVTRYSWYVCGVLMLATAVSTLDRFLFSVLMVPIKADFAMSDTQLGVLAGLGFTLLYCAMSIPLGRLADILVRRTMIAVAIAFWSLATLAIRTRRCWSVGCWWASAKPRLFRRRFR
jgi:MFS family permease